MTITLQGEVPSKKNSRINTKSGRSFPNQRYMKWHDSVVAELHLLILQKKLTRIPEDIPVNMGVTFFHGDMKRRDSDNQLSSILDTLVDAGVLLDDNWRVIPEKHIYDRYEKGNPHCVIEIKKMEGLV